MLFASVRSAAGNGLYSLTLAELPPAPLLQAVISAHAGDDPARLYRLLLQAFPFIRG